MRAKKLGLLVAGVLLSLSNLGLAGDGIWTNLSSGTTRDLNGVHGTSLSNVFMVGDYGTIRHFDGTSWSNQISTTTANLEGVWAAPDGTNAFAVGLNKVLRFNGSSWSSITVDAANYQAVWGTSMSDVFVAGYVTSPADAPKILHYDGSTWSEMDGAYYEVASLPVGPLPWELYDIWGTASNDVYAAGSQGLIIHYDGSDWSIVCGLNALEDTLLYSADIYYGIWGAGGKIFAGGELDQVYPYKGIIAYDTGDFWIPRNWAVQDRLWIKDVWGMTEESLFAVGHYYGSGYRGQIFEYDGSTWVEDMSYPGASNTPPRWLGVWGMSEDYFVVGETGAVMRYEAPLGILSTTPANGATEVSTTSTIRVTFTKPVEASTVTSTTFSVSGVAGTITYDEPTRTATLTPSVPLAVYTSYTGTITTGVETPEGGHLEEPFTWSFSSEMGPDIYPPTVISNYPPIGATGVARSVVVSATFSEDMDPSKFNALTFKLNNLHLTGPVSYDEATRTATMDPMGLDYSKYCYAQLTTGLCDTNGNYMTSEYAWEFTTLPAPDTTAPTITGTDPADEATDVPATNRIFVYFSESISEASQTNSEILYISGLSGSVDWVNDSTVRFTPASNMNYLNAYTVQVGTNICDTAGNYIDAPYAFSFQVQDIPDTNPPVVVFFVPADSSAGIDVDSSVAVTFSEDMNTNTLVPAAFNIQGVTGTVGYDEISYTAVFTPVSNLLFTQSYTVHLSSNVADNGGNGIASNLSWSFTTAATADTTPPYITDHDPAENETGVSSTAKVSVVFNEDMDGISVGSCFYLKGMDSTVVYNSAEKMATLTPGTAFNPAGVYTSVVALARDVAGNTMTESVEWTFTVAPVADADAPSSSATPEGGFFAIGTGIVLSATDAVYSAEALNIHFTTDETVPTLESPVYTEPISVNANMTVQFFAVDPGGNQETVQTEVYVVDMMPPVTTASPTGGTLHVSPSLITLSAVDEGGSGLSNIYYVVDTQNPEWLYGYSQYEGPISLEDWRHRLNFYAVDSVGNTEAVQCIYYEVLDHGEWEWQDSGVMTNLWDIQGTSASDIYVVGDGGTILHYNGISWGLENSGIVMELFGLHISEGGVVYIAGDEGTVVSGSSGLWTVENTGAPYAMRDIWAAPDGTVFAVGDGSAIYRKTGGVWERMDTAGLWMNDIYAVWGFSSSDVYVVGKLGGFAHFDGEEWSRISLPQTTESGYALYDIWGTSAADLFIAGRPDSRLLHSEGNDWMIMDNLSDNTIYGLWGFSGNNVLAVGNYGEILHWNGSVWTSMNDESKASVILRGVWGDACDSVYAVGSHGWIIHYTNSTFCSGDYAAPTTTPSPGPGPFGEPVEVTLTADDGGGSGVAAIYYTLGPELVPTTVYSQPIQIVSSSHLKFYAVDVVGNREAIQDCGYQLGAATNPGLLQADFKVDVVAGCSPVNSVYTDLSSGTVTNWLWDFGDGTTAPGASATHGYSKAGIYTVTLRVSGPDGTSSESKTNWIQVGPLDSWPAPDSVGIDVTNGVDFSFRMPITNIIGSITLSYQNGTIPISGFIHEVDEETIYFEPDSNLPAGEKITVTLAGGSSGLRQRDSDAYMLEDNYVYSFHTAPFLDISVIQVLEGDEWEQRMIAGKPTMVRVYCGDFTDNSAGVSVSAKLWMKRPGGDYEEIAEVRKSGVRDYEKASNLEKKDGKNSINFYIPDELNFSEAGEHVIAVDVLPAGDAESVYLETTVMVYEVSTQLTVEFVALREGSWSTMDDWDHNAYYKGAHKQARFLRDAYPLPPENFKAIIEYTELELYAWLYPWEYHLKLAWLIKLNAWGKKNSGIYIVIGILPSGVLSTSGESAGEDYQAALVTFNAPPATSAHEIMHTMGEYFGSKEDYFVCLPHGSFCDRGWRPSQKNMGCKINLSTNVHEDFWGDIEGTGPKIHSFMAKAGGGDYWPNAENYNKLLTRLNTGIPPTTGAKAETAVPEISSTSPAGGDMSVLSGMIFTNGDVWMNPIVSSDDFDSEDPSPVPSLYRAEFYAGSVLLRSYGFNTLEMADTNSVCEMFGFVAAVPYGTDLIQIRTDSGTLLSSITISPNAPTVSLDYPSGGELLEGEVTVTWSASDADGDTLTHSLYFKDSADAAWRLIADGMTETRTVWNTTWVGGTDDGYLRVITSDGFQSSSDETTVPFTLPEKTLGSVIVSPEDGDTFTDLETIPCQVLLYDPQGYAISDSNVLWYSSVDGLIGSGAACTATNLSPGSHWIMVQAVSAVGLTNLSDAVEIRVAPLLVPLNPDTAWEEGWKLNWFGILGSSYEVMCSTNVRGTWVSCPGVEDEQGHSRGTAWGQDEDITLIAPIFDTNRCLFYRLNINP